MKTRFLYSFMALLIVFSGRLVACTTAAPIATEQPTEAATTAAPIATEQPTEAVTEAPYVPMKVEAPNCDYGGEFLSIEAVDQQTVKFTLCYPDPAFASKVAFSVFSILDTEYLDRMGGDSVLMSDEPNGTGPYLLKEWVRGDHITYEANPNFWGTPAIVKTVIFRWSEQSAQRKLELESGMVDGIDNPAPEDFESIRANTELQLNERQALNIFYVGFNNDTPPFDNVLVRKAISMGIDRQRIVDEYYPEGSQVAKTFVPPALVPGYNPDQSWYDYDPEEAKKLLAEAGYENGLEITLSFRNVVRGYLATPDKVAQELQGQLAEIGVTVKLEQMESAAFIDATSAGQRGFYLLGWSADYPDSTNFYNMHFADENNKQFGALYPDIVEEILAAGKVADPKVRQEHYNKVNDLLKEYVVMIPVCHGASATAFKASVNGQHASPLTNEIFAVMDNGSDTMVWMQNGEPAALWCSDETDGETLRGCEMMYEALLSYKIGGVEVEPGLADTWQSNEDATVWTFHLREGVKFFNGATLDANDVVHTFVSQWDAMSPNHKGRTTTFEYFGGFFGSFLNGE